MSEPETTMPAASDLVPEEIADLGVYPSYTDGFEHSLVVLAMGEECWLISASDGHHLYVGAAAAKAMREQLACFDRESLGWPPVAVSDAAPHGKKWPLSPLLWVLGLGLVYWEQHYWPGFTDAGLLDSRQVLERGEWWRIISALWLHADLGHLASNAGSGLLVFSAVVATFGLEMGWSFIAGSAISGNLVALAFHYGKAYRSLGASTAVFGALGLLTGHALRLTWGRRQFRRPRALFFPLASGLTVLCLYGLGDVRVDMLGHFAGFAAGLVIGLIGAKTPIEKTSEQNPL